MTEPTSAQELFKGRHFDQEIIVLCVRWYLTFKLSSRDDSSCKCMGYREGRRLSLPQKKRILMR